MKAMKVIIVPYVEDQNEPSIPNFVDNFKKDKKGQLTQLMNLFVEHFDLDPDYVEDEMQISYDSEYGDIDFQVHDMHLFVHYT